MLCLLRLPVTAAFSSKRYAIREGHVLEIKSKVLNTILQVALFHALILLRLVSTKGYLRKRKKEERDEEAVQERKKMKENDKDQGKVNIHLFKQH